LLLYDVYFHALDAEKNNPSIILQLAFCCCVFMKLDDIVIKLQTIKSAVCHGSRFSRATKPCPQKLTDFIDRLTCP